MYPSSPTYLYHIRLRWIARLRRTKKPRSIVLRGLIMNTCGPSAATFPFPALRSVFDFHEFRSFLRTSRTSYRLTGGHRRLRNFPVRVRDHLTPKFGFILTYTPAKSSCNYRLQAAYELLGLSSMTLQRGYRRLWGQVPSLSPGDAHGTSPLICSWGFRDSSYKNGNNGTGFGRAKRLPNLSRQSILTTKKGGFRLPFEIPRLRSLRELRSG